MSQALVEQLKKSRQSKVKSGNFTFIITRPTAQDMAEIRSASINQKEIFSKFVVGWEDVKEIDIVSSGDDSPAIFSHELFLLWIADHDEHWLPIANAIFDAYKKHRDKSDDATKN